MGHLLDASKNGEDSEYRAEFILFSIENFDLIIDFLMKLKKETKYKKPGPRDPVERSLKELENSTEKQKTDKEVIETSTGQVDSITITVHQYGYFTDSRGDTTGVFGYMKDIRVPKKSKRDKQ